MLLMAACVIATTSSSARATVDLTGNWEVVGQLYIDLRAPFDVRYRWLMIQDNDRLFMTYAGFDLPQFVGSVDPESGAFSVTAVSRCQSLEDSFSGFLTARGTLAISGVIQVNRTPTMCVASGASLEATRLPCGDGVLDAGERCDDGHLLGDDCCSFTCTAEPNDKRCDDDNPATANTVCLNAVCTLPGLCGNGRLDPGESCDDGNQDATDCCSPTCTIDSDGTLCDDGVANTLFNVCRDGQCTTPSGVLETQINSVTQGPQFAPGIGCNAGDGFVVTWNDNNLVVRSRHFDNASHPDGGDAFDLRTPPEYASPRVAALGGGEFVTVWPAIEESRVRILARRFDRTGASLGPRLHVSADAVTAFNPDVASDAAGNFVVVWQQRDVGEVSEPFRIAARRYDRTGAPLGSEIPVVGSFPTVSLPRVAAEPSGRFVIVWQIDTDLVRAQWFLPSGVPEGPVLFINQRGQGVAQSPHVSASAVGTFVVSWIDDTDRLIARRYSNAGEPLGTDVELPVYSGDVAMDASGNFVLVGTTPSDGSGTGIIAQRFSSDGTAMGEAFAVNGFTFSDQSNPSACAMPGGDFVITWQSAQQDGSGSGVFARLFDGDGEPPTLSCPGDCDGNHTTSVDEVVMGVNIILGRQTLNECLALDRDANHAATVDEVVGAVNALLKGC